MSVSGWQNVYVVDGQRLGAGRFVKDPASIEKYVIQWNPSLVLRDPLDVSHDTLTTSVWSVPAGLTEVSSAGGATSTSITLSGGTAGDSYTVSNTVTTSSGTTLKRSIIIRCKDL